MDHSKKITYLYSIDALRVLSILAVIAIHVSIVVLQNLNHIISLSYSTFFINQSTRFAVPLFFLISGFVLELNYKKKISYFIFFKKRASRVILPFIFWSIIYTIYSDGFIFLRHINFNFLNFIIQGKASYHLYFIPTLIIFYLTFPIFHAIINILKKPLLLSLIIFFQLYLLYVDYYVKSFTINPNLRIALLSFSLFILGMVASHNVEKIIEYTKRYLIFIVSIFTFLLFFIPYHVYSLSTQFKTTSYIYSQYHPLNFLYSIIFGLLLFFFFEKTQFAKKIFIEFSKLSFSVFFVHVLIQYLIWNNVVKILIDKFGKELLTKFYFTPLLFFIICALSFSFAFITHKIPRLSKITG